MNSETIVTQLRAKISKLEIEINSYTVTINSYKTEINNYKVEISNYKIKIEQYLVQIKTYEVKIQSIQTELTTLKSSQSTSSTSSYSSSYSSTPSTSYSSSYSSTVPSVYVERPQFMSFDDFWKELTVYDRSNSDDRKIMDWWFPGEQHYELSAGKLRFWIRQSLGREITKDEAKENLRLIEHQRNFNQIDKTSFEKFCNEAQKPLDEQQLKTIYNDDKHGSYYPNSYMSFDSWMTVRSTLLKDIYKIWKAMDAEKKKESSGSSGYSSSYSSSSSGYGGSGYSSSSYSSGYGSSSSSSSSVDISTIMREYDAAVRREGGRMTIARAQTLWRSKTTPTLSEQQIADYGI